MKRKTLHVTLDVTQPSIVELTLGDKVQLDRVISSPRATSASATVTCSGRA
jgi:hypothetical protein